MNGGQTGPAGMVQGWRRNGGTQHGHPNQQQEGRGNNESGHSGRSKTVPFVGGGKQGKAKQGLARYMGQAQEVGWHRGKVGGCGRQPHAARIAGGAAQRCAAPLSNRSGGAVWQFNSSQESAPVAEEGDEGKDGAQQQGGGIPLTTHVHSHPPLAGGPHQPPSLLRAAW
jgi:hypothetical protein